jgi:ABC-2 type transport system permease protein
MVKTLWVALREVRSFLQDKGNLAFSLLLPIAVFALTYGAFGGQSLFHVTAHVVNEDQGGTYSSLLLNRLGELKDIDVELLSAAKADSKIARSDLSLVLYIPKDFSNKLTLGESAQLIFKQRGNGTQEGQIVASMVRGVAQQLAQEFQVQSQVQNILSGQNIPPDSIRMNVQKFLDREREHPIVEVSEKVIGTRPDPVKQFLPGILTMFVLFALTLNARAIVEERKKGTLERLMTTRLTVGQLFVGKFVAGILRGFVQTLILLILAYIVFKIFTPFSFLGSLLIAIIFSAAASAMGLVIAVIVRTEDAATWIGVFFTMVMTMLSGAFFPIPQGSIWGTLSKISINTFANDAFSIIITEGRALTDVGLELGILAGVAVIGVILSRVFFRVLPGSQPR